MTIINKKNNRGDKIYTYVFEKITFKKKEKKYKQTRVKIANDR